MEPVPSFQLDLADIIPKVETMPERKAKQSSLRELFLHPGWVEYEELVKARILQIKNSIDPELNTGEKINPFVTGLKVTIAMFAIKQLRFLIDHSRLLQREKIKEKTTTTA